MSNTLPFVACLIIWSACGIYRPRNSVSSSDCLNERCDSTRSLGTILLQSKVYGSLENSSTKGTDDIDGDEYICGDCHEVWDKYGGDHTCGDRITFLKTDQGYTDHDAKVKVCVDEFPNECGSCCSKTGGHDGNVSLLPYSSSSLFSDIPIGTSLTTDSQLTVMSYNVWYQAFTRNSGQRSCKFKTQCYQGDRCAQNEEIQKWSPDVIGTQELGGDDCADMLSAKVGPTFKKAEGGEALLYNANTVVLIPNTHGHNKLRYCDTWSCRAFGWAKYKILGGNFVFWHFNVHMTHEHCGSKCTEGDHNPAGYQGLIAQDMIAKYKEVSPCGETMVFTGDWNPHKDMLANKMPWDGGINAAEDVLVQNGFTKLEKPGPKQDGDICKYCDRIFYTTLDFDIVEQRTGKRAGSDHTPHIAKLKLKRHVDCTR